MSKAFRGRSAHRRGSHLAYVSASFLRVLACCISSTCVTSCKGAADPESPEPVVVSPERARVACRVEAALPVGLSEHRITSSGIERRFLVYLPVEAGPGAWPVVFNLHGSGGTPEEQLALSALSALADAKRFMVVAPAAVDARWNVPPDPGKADDVRFISDVVDALSSFACVDAERVYATGFSGGGRMSSQLACDLSMRIAAIAAIGGIRFPGPCTGTRPVPILAFHGTGDEVNPYDGGGQPYWGTGVEPAIEGWARHNGCAIRSEDRVAAAVDALAYAGETCADVILYRIEGFSHSWPGALGVVPPGAATEPLGSMPQEWTANDLLWSFFEQHSAPASSGPGKPL